MDSRAFLFSLKHFPGDAWGDLRGFAPSTRAVPWTQFRMQQTVSFIQFPGEAWGTMRGFTPHPSRDIVPAPNSGNSNLYLTDNFPVKRREPCGVSPLHPQQGHCPCTQYRKQQFVSYKQFPGEAWGTMRGFTPAPHKGHRPLTRCRNWQFISHKQCPGETEQHAHTFSQEND